MRDNQTAEPTPGPKPRPPRPLVTLLPPKLINSRPTPCRTLPLAPIPSNGNLATVSPGSHFPNKQTNRPANWPALVPCAARDSCAPPPPPPLTPCSQWSPGCGAPVRPRLRAALSSAPPRLQPPPRAFVDSSLGPAWPESPASSRRSSRGPQARRPTGRLGPGGGGSASRARRPLPCAPLLATARAPPLRR